MCQESVLPWPQYTEAEQDSCWKISSEKFVLSVLQFLNYVEMQSLAGLQSEAVFVFEGMERFTVQCSRQEVLVVDVGNWNWNLTTKHTFVFSVSLAALQM